MWLVSLTDSDFQKEKNILLHSTTEDQQQRILLFTFHPFAVQGASAGYFFSRCFSLSSVQGGPHIIQTLPHISTWGHLISQRAQAFTLGTSPSTPVWQDINSAAGFPISHSGFVNERPLLCLLSLPGCRGSTEFGWTSISQLADFPTALQRSTAHVSQWQASAAWSWDVIGRGLCSFLSPLAAIHILTGELAPVCWAAVCSGSSVISFNGV